MDRGFADGGPVAVAGEDDAVAFFRDDQGAVFIDERPFAVVEQDDAAVGVGQHQAVGRDVDAQFLVEGVGGRAVEFNVVILEVGEDAAGAEDAVGVITLRKHRTVTDAVDRGVDELRVAARAVELHENGGVAHDLRVAPAADGQDVAFLQIVEIGDVHFAAVLGLVLGRAAQVVEAEMTVDVAGVAGAVEPVRPVGAVAVFRAQELLRIFDQFVGQLAGGDLHLARVALRSGLRVHGGCCKEHQRQDQQEEGRPFHLPE